MAPAAFDAFIKELDHDGDGVVDFKVSPRRFCLSLCFSSCLPLIGPSGHFSAMHGSHRNITLALPSPHTHASHLSFLRQEMTQTRRHSQELRRQQLRVSVGESSPRAGWHGWAWFTPPSCSEPFF